MFLEGITYQLSAFAMSKNVDPSDVLVRLILEDGELIFARELKTIGPFAGSEWGMLLGVGRSGEAGLLLRESYVIRAELELVPRSPGMIGFVSESKLKET